MTYSEALEILNFTTPKSFTENAALATSLLSCLAPTAPLKIKVACQVLISYSEVK